VPDRKKGCPFSHFYSAVLGEAVETAKEAKMTGKNPAKQTQTKSSGEPQRKPRSRAVSGSQDPDPFQSLFDRLSAIDLFGDAPPVVPYPLPPQVRGVEAVIDQGIPKMPQTFVEAYAAPLEKALPGLLAKVDPTSTDDLSMLETLTGAVYEHGDPDVAVPLGRFLAVISDLYRSFLSKKRRVAAGFPLLEALPPLAMFQHEGAGGPFTLPCDSTGNMFGASVGVVSMPAVYAPHPLLWGALCHETGGHDVTHADAGLLPELQSGVKSLFGTAAGASGLMGQLWSYWMDEASADVYGLLNMGPAFGLNLIALFTALNAQVQNSATKTPLLRTASGFDPNDPQKFLDEHPTDLLRPYLAIGVIQSLRSLPQNIKDAYSAQLDQLARRCAPNADSIILAGVIADGSGARDQISRSLPLPQMILAARQVGAFIATAQLDSLSGHSIQDIETWDANDEQTARQIAAALVQGSSVAGMGDDAQLLAGATVAAFARPDLYDGITSALNTALDESFATDPFWGKPPRERALLRFASGFSQLPFSESARICVACIRKLTGFSGGIDGADALSSLGFVDQTGLDDLVHLIAQDPQDGVPSANFRVPNPSSLNPSLSTTVSALEISITNDSIPV
jgi:hypothetical protein